MIRPPRYRKGLPVYVPRASRPNPPPASKAEDKPIVPDLLKLAAFVACAIGIATVSARDPGDGV
jgi:hypothetical protein